MQCKAELRLQREQEAEEKRMQKLENGDKAKMAGDRLAQDFLLADSDTDWVDQNNPKTSAVIEESSSENQIEHQPEIENDCGELNKMKYNRSDTKNVALTSLRYGISKIPTASLTNAA